MMAFCVLDTVSCSAIVVDCCCSIFPSVCRSPPPPPPQFIEFLQDFIVRGSKIAALFLYLLHIVLLTMVGSREPRSGNSFMGLIVVFSFC